MKIQIASDLHLEPILALLEAGVDLDAADAFGHTALHQAVTENKPEVYALLAQRTGVQTLARTLHKTSIALPPGIRRSCGDDPVVFKQFVNR